MELIKIEDYKEALEQAAWASGVYYAATDDWGASGMSDMPAVFIGVFNKKDADGVRSKFVEELDKVTGQRGLFNVRAVSIQSVLEYPRYIIEKGAWVFSAS